MAQALILTSERAGVVTLSLNRPQKRNALTRELLTELAGSLREIESRADVRLLLLTGTGSAFCAGMDLGQMEETASRPDAREVWQADAALYRDVVATLFQLHCPTLAVVPGPALAGGLGLVAACDLVLAADKATFALPEPKRGITAAIVTPLLVYRTGAAAASLLLFSGKPVSAEPARELGLCHAVVPADQLSQAADELAGSVLTGAPGALATTKRLLLACAGPEVLAQLDRALVVSAEARETAEAREGLQAFLEKRPPAWNREKRG
ncbi:MAG: enoyl-CoA hydratase/isomerase family protein [Planctomycetaceae bacterium]